MFRLSRNERSHWSGNGVHVESELVFMIGRNMHRASGNANKSVGASKKPRKIRLDSRRRLSRMPLPQQPKAASLFNNLNQAICVGTHSIEHQKQFLISMSDEVTKATFSCSS